MEFLATKTDSEHVREFTGEAGQPIPEKPSAMTQTETKFISKMILDEVVSFLFFSLRFLIRSLSHSSHSSHSLSHSSLSLSLKKKIQTQMELMATHWGPEESKSILTSFINDSEDLPKETFEDTDESTQEYELLQAAAQGKIFKTEYYFFF